MVKVGFLLPCFVVGGLERWALNLARFCDPSRIQWTGVALTEWSVENTRIVGEMNRYMPVYGTVVPINSTDHDNKYMRRPGPDASTGIKIVASSSDVVISCVNTKLDVMMEYYRRNYGVKVVCVSHSSFSGNFESVQDSADFLAAVSEPAKAQYKADTSRPIEIIHGGSDIERCVPIVGRNAFRANHGIRDDEIVLTYIGRFSKEKNPLAVARVAAAMGKQFRAVYAGGGCSVKGNTDEEWLPQLREICGDQLCFVGPQDRVGDVLAASDVVISCSFSEGFSLSLIEAWLAGIPTVSTPVGALPEIEARHGQLSMMVPSNPTTVDIVSGVAKALGHSSYGIVDKARLLAWNNYTSAAMAERWTNYLERAAGVKSS